MMVMADVVSQLPKMAQVRGLGPRVGGCLVLFCIHCVKPGVRHRCSDFMDMLRHRCRIIIIWYWHTWV